MHAPAALPFSACSGLMRKTLTSSLLSVVSFARRYVTHHGRVLPGNLTDLIDEIMKKKKMSPERSIYHKCDKYV